MDILTFGAPKIVRNLTSHKIETTEIILKDVLENLDLNQEQFIDFCILLGTDYLSGISELKPIQIYKYFKMNKNIEETILHIKKDNFKIPKDFNYKEVKDYFLHPIVNEVSKENLKLFVPDSNKLLKKLVNEYGLIKILIKNKLEKLDNAYHKLKDL
jgi:flap endonuclease-1